MSIVMVVEILVFNSIKRPFVSNPLTRSKTMF